MNLLDLIERDVTLRKASNTDGGEYAGPCPFCQAGTDRFRVWPEPRNGPPHYWCRQCGKRGDAIQYLRDREGLSYAEACARLGVEAREGPRPPRPPAPPHGANAPPAGWRARAAAFVAECEAQLWSPAGAWYLAGLRKRGLTDATIRAARLGCYDGPPWQTRRFWGLEPDPQAPGKGVWTPRGVTIPTFHAGEVWKMTIRRPKQDLAREEKPKKYVHVSGGQSEVLYNAAALRPGQPAMLVEGVFDALAVQQVASDLIAVVAAGTTTGSRRVAWLARLALCKPILVGLDADAGGDAGARWWLERLPDPKIWRAYWDDPCAMLADSVDLRGWVEAGLKAAGAGQVEAPTAPVDRCWLCGGEVARYDGQGRAYCARHADFDAAAARQREVA